MKVILEKDVNGLGEKGEIVETSDGHARNYLIPKGLARKATDSNLHDLKQKKKAEARKAEKELKEAKEKANKISDKTYELSVKAGEQGRLFGSVTSENIADKIEAETGVKIDKRNIELDGNIKTLGVTKVDIKLHSEVIATVKIRVTEA